MRAYLALLPAALLLNACGKPPSGGGMPQAGTPQVEVVTVQPQRVALSTELPGRVSPVLIADIRPQISGIVQSRNFVEGGEVKAGELLYQIDPASYRASLGSAEASLAKAEANAKVAQLKAERYRELVAVKAISQQDADDAEASLQQAQADVASARASVDTARINLGYTRITAPISGRIGKSTVTTGALVTSNQSTALATIQKLDPVYVDLTQSSTSLLDLKRAVASGALRSVDGKSVKVSLILDNGSTYASTGKLKFSDVTVDTDTSAVTVRAEFPNPKGDLLPGMFVRAQVEEAINDKAILLPQQAISRDSTGQAIAYVVTADRKIEARPVTVERAVQNQWLISKGLDAGDQVAVSGYQKARPGQPVEVVGATAVSSSAASSAAAR